VPEFPCYSDELLKHSSTLRHAPISNPTSH
jgi:hypothetical protein